MRQLDWPVMIAELNKHGVNQIKIAQKIGVSPGTLSDVKAELIPPKKSWDEAIEFLDLWLKTTGLPPPRVGDYYAGERT